jgi:hypothetical protein
MATDNIRIALIVPVRADIVTIEVDMDSISPLTLIPQICC